MQVRRLKKVNPVIMPNDSAVPLSSIFLQNFGSIQTRPGPVCPSWGRRSAEVTQVETTNKLRLVQAGNARQRALRYWCDFRRVLRKLTTPPRSNVAN
jgi:hypothetical protein